MKNEMKKIIEAVGVIHVELAKIAAELDNESYEETAKEIEAEVVEEPNDSEETEGEYTAESLAEVGYNELKKIAAKLGVSAKGNRDKVIANILGASGAEDDGDDEDDEEPVEEEKKPKKKAKKNDKVADFAEKKEEHDENEEKYGEQADELLEDSDVSDVLSILKQVGIKGANKKNVRAKLIEALSKDLLSDYIEDGDGEEIDEDTYFSDFDEDGVNDPESIDNEKRLSTMKEVQSDILTKIESGKLTEKNMKKFLLATATEDEKGEIENYDEDEVIAAYCELRKRMVDDDGDDMSTDDGAAYYINEELYQYGHHCKLVDGDTWVSEVTGDEWDA